MVGQESWIAQLSAQTFDQGNEVMGNVMKGRLDSYVNGGTAGRVQTRSIIDSMLQLIRRQWGWGEGSAATPHLIKRPISATVAA
jgi:hypothetical protein